MHARQVNPELVCALEGRGLLFSGKDESQQRMEVVELAPEAHPYFVAVQVRAPPRPRPAQRTHARHHLRTSPCHACDGAQFHPEFKSRPQRPAPVFLGLLQVPSLPLSLSPLSLPRCLCLPRPPAGAMPSLPCPL
jgi:CTP synthase